MSGSKYITHQSKCPVLSPLHAPQEKRVWITPTQVSQSVTKCRRLALYVTAKGQPLPPPRALFPGPTQRFKIIFLLQFHLCVRTSYHYPHPQTSSGGCIASCITQPHTTHKQSADIGFGLRSRLGSVPDLKSTPVRIAFSIAHGEGSNIHAG